MRNHLSTELDYATGFDFVQVEIATRLSSTAKKPVVLASNRGRSFLKTIKLVEWCDSLIPLEPFFKDKARCERALTLSPHLSPRRGYPPVCNRPVFTSVLSWFGCLAASPTSVGFMARTARLAWTPCSPKTSLIAHAKTSSPTDGFTSSKPVKDTMSFRRKTG